MIPLSRPFLPPQVAYQAYIDAIWQRQWLTNFGPVSNQFEQQLRDYLQVQGVLYVTNGTVALQIALKALATDTPQRRPNPPERNEIITTPFSYVATTSAIVWEGYVPVMADIDPRTLNIDPEKIRDKITDRTAAIVATHVYGNPCAIDEIQAIAKELGVKVIYDAAHGFGAAYRNRSLLDWGDIATTSFHATKLFHTIEGGGIFTRDADLLAAMALMRNFGHTAPDAFDELGINGKNSEFHAAMGLCNLPYVEAIIARRAALSACYDAHLHTQLGHTLHQPLMNPDCTRYNYAYYPLIFNSEADLLRVKAALEAHQITTRRYFYPCLAHLPYLQRDDHDTPIADDLTTRVLALPLYYDLTEAHIAMITAHLKEAL
jgi:dTDP-4-amino-4,6-dideoxygalactose transaminase